MIIYMVSSDKNNILKEEKVIIKKTDIKEISYYNKYNNYYIVMDNDYLYLIDKEYKIVSKLDRSLIHENNEKYEIVYEDGAIYYFSDKLNNKQVEYVYYDIYTYEVVKRVLLGG